MATDETNGTNEPEETEEEEEEEDGTRVFLLVLGFIMFTAGIVKGLGSALELVVKDSAIIGNFQIAL